jgi:hypothetical protein
MRTAALSDIEVDQRAREFASEYRCDPEYQPQPAGFSYFFTPAA